MLELDLLRGLAGQPGLHALGLDLVAISHVRDSLARFGDAFAERLFTAGERAWADSAPDQKAERLAARFAAKEAVIKALSLGEAGVDWRDIEVVRGEAGQPSIALHGKARELATHAGVTRMAVSLSHDGDYAGAVVAALSYSPTIGDCPESASCPIHELQNPPSGRSSSTTRG